MEYQRPSSRGWRGFRKQKGGREKGRKRKGKERGGKKKKKKQRRKEGGGPLPVSVCLETA